MPYFVFMKSIPTKINETIKNILSLSEYYLWLLADPSKFKKIDKNKIKKVLIIHLGAIGELVLTTPIFPALKKELNCQMSFLVSGGKEPVFENNPYISEVITPKESFKENIRQLRSRNYDLAIILYPATLKINLICLLAKIKYRIGCFPIIRGGPSLLLTKRIFPPVLNKKNVIEENLQMIRQIGIDNPAPKLEFYLSKKEDKELKIMLNKLKVKDYAIVHPGYSYANKYEFSSKLWPLERYAEVVDYLIEKYNFKVFLTGNKDEKDFSDKIMNLIKNKNNVIIANEIFNLRGLSALISQARVFFCAPTGIVHIGMAFNTPTIQLFGIGDYEKWHIPNDNFKILFHPEVCTGCYKPYCRKKNPECMNAITSEEAIESIGKMLLKKER